VPVQVALACGSVYHLRRDTEDAAGVNFLWIIKPDEDYKVRPHIALEQGTPVLGDRPLDVLRPMPRRFHGHADVSWAFRSYEVYCGRIHHAAGVDIAGRPPSEPARTSIERPTGARSAQHAAGDLDNRHVEIVCAASAHVNTLPTVDTANRPWPTGVAPRRISSVGRRVARPLPERWPAVLPRGVV
jgi:hypothetical protein